MKRETFRSLVSLVLSVALLLQPFYGVKVLAEAEPTLEPAQSVSDEPTSDPQITPQPTTEPQNSPSPTPGSPDEANASEQQTTSVTNENSAEITNDVSATANTGNNEVNPSPTVTPELSSDNLRGTPTPTISPEPTGSGTSDSAAEETNSSLSSETCSEISPTPSTSQPTGNLKQASGSSSFDNPENSSEPTLEETASPTPTPLTEPIPTPGQIAENIETPNNSQNEALCKSESEGFVANDNQAQVENDIVATASSGQNDSLGEETQTIGTGEATISADLANNVNFNVIGEDFWTEVFNLMGVNNRDLDFSDIDLEQEFQEAILTVLAKNLATGDSSTNIAVADFLSSLSVFNDNIATVSNILDLSAISGQNSAVGGDGEIYTGSASVYVNLFNLINTNLVGTNFWFGIFNIFGEQNGDIILPYEWQFLLKGISGTEEIGGTQVEAINQNTGENSQNLAGASMSGITTVENTNQAKVSNSVDVLADSGTNTAVVGESANINTGNATTKVDIRNFINTNIFGNRFVFLLINVFGEWKGTLLGWWGDLFSDESMVIALGQRPVPTPANSVGLVSAQNQETGENSSNIANASSTNILEVTNNNEAYLTNKIKGQAISGQNEVQGTSADIKTGNSSVIANVANFVNTNIIGNNFFFGIINIFGKLCGNILFPRPDLEIGKSADKQFATPGEEINYSISYKNSGRLWAKDVIVSDNLPAGVTFVSASNGGIFEDGMVIWKLGKISSGEGGTLSVTVRVNDDVFDGTQLVNQASVSTSTDEPSKGNNQSTVRVLVEITPPPGEGEEVEGPGVGGPGIGGSSAGGEGVADGGGPCLPPKAPQAPTLLSATAISSTEVQLNWSAVDRASYYLVAYGLSSGNYIYGSPNVGNVTSYTVGGLTSGTTYYFVVAAVANGGCPAAGPYSNELPAIPGYGLGGILGIGEALAAPKEGEIGEGISTEIGEVAGASLPLCPWWWIVLAAEAVLLGGFYALILKKAKSLRFWWLATPALTGLAFLADRLAHNWWIPSQYCQYVLWGGLAIGGIETLGYNFLKRKIGRKK